MLLTRSFLVVALANFAYFTAIGALLPVLPRYVEGPLGGGPAMVGMVMGAFGVGAILLRPLAGRLGDQRGRRVLLTVGGTVAALSIAAYAAADSTAALLGLRFVTGAGEALFFVGAASVVADVAPEERRGEALSIFSLSLYGGMAAGPVLGERLLLAAGFDVVWYVAAGCMLLGVLLATWLPETRVAAPAPPGWGRLVHRAALLPGVILFASALSQVAFHAFVTLHALQIGLAGASVAFVTFSAVMIVVRSLGARIPDRLGSRRAAAIALVTSAGGMVVLAGWPQLAGLVAGAALLSAGQALTFPALMSVAIAGAAPSERGAAVGTFTSFVDLTFAGGGAALGAVAALAGYRGAFLAAAVVALAALGLLTRLGRVSAPPAPVAPPLPG